MKIGFLVKKLQFNRNFSQEKLHYSLTIILVKTWTWQSQSFSHYHRKVQSEIFFKIKFQSVFSLHYTLGMLIVATSQNLLIVWFFAPWSDQFFSVHHQRSLLFLLPRFLKRCCEYPSSIIDYNSNWFLNVRFVV